jgi:hypothetical protein
MVWHYTADREPKTGSRVRVHSSETWGTGTAIYRGQGQWDKILPHAMSGPLGVIDAWAALPVWWRIPLALPLYLHKRLTSG